MLTAASIGFFHTIMGPDHYLPFIMMAQSGQWSRKKTTIVTLLCGIGHVLSSIFLGFIGITFGIAVSKLEFFESFRGNIAAWALIAFGLVYLVWGVRQAWKNKPHTHFHSHGGDKHAHTHVHTDDHSHVHGQKKKSITPWVLFAIFVFGPCEPLIPLLMYPAFQSSMFGVVLVSLVFGLVTLATMLGMVLVTTYGIELIPTKKMERYTHAFAGATIFFCGVSIQFLGL